MITLIPNTGNHMQQYRMMAKSSILLQTGKELMEDLIFMSPNATAQVTGVLLKIWGLL